MADDVKCRATAFVPTCSPIVNNKENKRKIKHNSVQ
jgi:hypothetical protein